MKTLDSPEMQTYTMQALKRNHCFKVSRFIRLCDYLILTMLHDLTLDSGKHLLNSLKHLVDQAVEIEDIAEPIPEDEQEDEKVLLLPLRTPSTVQTTPSVRTTVYFEYFLLYIYYIAYQYEQTCYINT